MCAARRWFDSSVTRLGFLKCLWVPAQRRGSWQTELQGIGFSILVSYFLILKHDSHCDFYSGEEIAALVRAAANEQDAAVYLTAAMTGLRRGELVALRWRDIDFPGQAIRVRANYSHGELVTPKSGKVRSVPMVPEVAHALARLGQREFFTGDEDPVFVG
jgi:integrase